jgi:hypothetical protein
VCPPINVAHNAVLPEPSASHKKAGEAHAGRLEGRMIGACDPRVRLEATRQELREGGDDSVVSLAASAGAHNIRGSCYPAPHQQGQEQHCRSHKAVA